MKINQMQASETLGIARYFLLQIKELENDQGYDYQSILQVKEKLDRIRDLQTELFGEPKI